MNIEMIRDSKNKLICEFMGAVRLEDGRYNLINVLDFMEEGDQWNPSEYDLHEMRWDKSFDWIMYVVRKINACQYAGGITNEIREALMTGDIDAVCNAVVNFIIWYNKKTNNA